MLLEFLKLTLFGVSIGVASGLLINVLLKTFQKKKKPGEVRIKRTITSLDHTGRNYNEWMEYISILNNIADIKQERDTAINRKLNVWLESQNIFKINK